MSIKKRQLSFVFGSGKISPLKDLPKGILSDIGEADTSRLVVVNSGNIHSDIELIKTLAWSKRDSKKVPAYRAEDGFPIEVHFSSSEE